MSPVIRFVLLASLCFGFAPTIHAKRVKNMILLIGDGMGPQQVSMALIYARQAPGSKFKKSGLHLEKLMNQGTTGYALTYPAGAMVVDSAAAATQLATGKFAGSEMIGVDAFGNPQPTVLEKAKAAGMATGLVSNTRLTHATPASFAAHQPHRSLENEIAANMLATGPDVMLSGGLRHWIPKGVNQINSPTYRKLRQQVPAHIKLQSKRRDERDLLAEADQAGYHLAFDRKALKAASGKTLGLFASSGMPNAIIEHRTENDSRRATPTLAELAEHALRLLEKQSDRGFFLMLEAGQIDWAGHANDAGWMLHEMIQFDQAIGVVLEYAKRHPDTLVVMTADHETGSFGFSYSRYKIPKSRQLPGQAFRNVNFAPRFNFGEPDLLDRLYAQTGSFEDILIEFDTLKPERRTPKMLANIFNKHSQFKIDEDQARAVLATERHEYQVAKHPYLDVKRFPAVGDFKEYVVYPDTARTNLLGRAVAREQNAVWGTGTHTTTMVPVIAYGNPKVTRRFNGVQHHTDIGQKLFEVLGLNQKNNQILRVRSED